MTRPPDSREGPRIEITTRSPSKRLLSSRLRSLFPQRYLDEMGAIRGMALKSVVRPGRSGPGLFAAGVAAALLASGCGGSSGGGSPDTGDVVVRITFPIASRLIPRASNSVRIRVLIGQSPIAQAIVARPAQGGTATATLNSVPVGSVSIDSAAFPTTDATGVAQATATVPFVVHPAVVNRVDLTMASTI